MPVLTYIDTGVLILAYRGVATLSTIALSFLYDPLREYVISDYLGLELFPNSTYNRKADETQFYEEFLANANHYVPTSSTLLAFALEEGCKIGVSGIDAIHIACAVSAGAAEFITTEKRTKPMHRTTLIRVVCINPT